MEKTQADSLRASRRDVTAYRIPSADEKEQERKKLLSSMLKTGDLVFVEAGQHIPADGIVVEGAASVDESTITGESAPVIRETQGERNSVTGGTTVISDYLVIQVTKEAGERFLDKMIAMVEGAARKKTPNEIALEIFLVALTIIFIFVTLSLYAFSSFSARQADRVNPTTITSLIALLVCLAPTTIGALLSAIGIAGMSRLNRANVLAMSGRAIEAAGDVDVLLLDKTGTITLGNRKASAFIPVDGASEQELADAAQLSSLADETPEGRSVVILAKEKFNIRGRELSDKNMTFIPFTAKTRMSGVDYDGNEIRKGAADTMQKYVTESGGIYSEECDRIVKEIANKGGTPLVVAKNHKILGVIHLKDIIKQGVKEKFADLRKMGIKTIMITGDNPMTAAAIAAEAGVDDFLAEATPEGKLQMIRDFQSKGHLVAMTGDGTNDAPALAQADVAVAMNTGTQAAKEAGNMVDLDNDPTKLIEIVEIGKQLLLETAAYAESSICRRKSLLHYFGEEYTEENCGNCDNCLNPKKQVEAQDSLCAVIEAIIAVKENFKADYIIDILLGKETSEVLAHKHEELEVFGSGMGEEEKMWNAVIRQALIAGYLSKDVENYGLLKVTPEGHKFLKKPKSFKIVEDNDFIIRFRKNLEAFVKKT